MEIQFLNLNQAGEEEMALWSSWLTEVRREELSRMREPKPHLCAEALARQMLSHHLGIPPAAVVITRIPGGKPVTEGAWFSLSHSGCWVVCAVADDPVGIDLECLRPVSNRLQQHFGTEDSLTFFAHWTAMEARVKCLGDSVLCWRDYLADPLGCTTRTVVAPEGYVCTACLKKM